MHKIFQNSGWANPKAIASEAGPSTSQISSSSENENIKEKSKKRKIKTALEDILEKKDKQIKREEKKMLLDLRHLWNKEGNNMKKR